jgi:hypothetical protein
MRHDYKDEARINIDNYFFKVFAKRLTRDTRRLHSFQLILPRPDETKGI